MTERKVTAEHLSLATDESSVQTTAERIARHAHRDQTDRAGKPYIGHIERVVANLLRSWPDANDDEIAAAWLHDVIEDTDYTAESLLEAGISQRAVAIVQEVTRPENLTYHEWIESLAQHGSLSAIKVKLADNADNSSPERIGSISEGPNMLKKRYLPAKKTLEDRLNAS